MLVLLVLFIPTTRLSLSSTCGYAIQFALEATQVVIFLFLVEEWMMFLYLPFLFISSWSPNTLNLGVKVLL
jgi:hypothetical protein